MKASCFSVKNSRVFPFSLGLVPHISMKQKHILKKVTVLPNHVLSPQRKLESTWAEWILKINILGILSRKRHS